MRRRVIGLLAALSLLAAMPAGDASAQPVAHLHAAKHCSSGFKHGVIEGRQKCLRKGEFCIHTHRANRDYHRYGYHCGTRDRNGRYHLRYY
jgi:hypothetical protein